MIVLISHKDYRVLFLAKLHSQLRAAVRKQPEGKSVFEVNSAGEITNWLPDRDPRDLAEVAPKLPAHAIRV